MHDSFALWTLRASGLLLRLLHLNVARLVEAGFTIRADAHLRLLVLEREQDVVTVTTLA